MDNLDSLNRRIESLENRNQKVEADKAWETSYSRRILLVVFTYLAIGIYMFAIGVSSPWLNAIVPSTGFLLSTLTLPFFKKIWLKRGYKK